VINSKNNKCAYCALQGSDPCKFHCTFIPKSSLYQNIKIVYVEYSLRYRYKCQTCTRHSYMWDDDTCKKCRSNNKKLYDPEHNCFTCKYFITIRDIQERETFYCLLSQKDLSELRKSLESECEFWEW